MGEHAIREETLNLEFEWKEKIVITSYERKVRKRENNMKE